MDRMTTELIIAISMKFENVIACLLVSHYVPSSISVLLAKWTGILLGGNDSRRCPFDGGTVVGSLNSCSSLWLYGERKDSSNKQEFY